jgi:hypothetical protein
VAGGDAGYLHDADALLEPGAEAGVVLVLDRLVGVSHLDLLMADDGAEWRRPLRDGGRKSATAHLQHIPAEELHQVGSMAANVRKRAGAGAPLYRQVIGPIGSRA